MRSNIHSRDFSERNLSDAVINLFKGLESAGWKDEHPAKRFLLNLAGCRFYLWLPAHPV